MSEPEQPAETTDVVNYSTMPKSELQELCRARELPVSGTNVDLIARLEGWDAKQGQPEDDDDLLNEIEREDQETGEPPADQGSVVAKMTATTSAQRPAAKMPELGPEIVQTQPQADRRMATPTTFEIAFAMSGRELSTGLHQDYQKRAYDEAVAAGHQPRGGLAGSSHVGL